MQRREFDVPEYGAAVKSGICSNCVHRDGCGWAAQSATAIWQCDEFAPGPAPAQRPVAAAAPREGVQGLCVSCENAGTCTLPGRSGGVWFCEEHR